MWYRVQIQPLPHWLRVHPNLTTNRHSETNHARILKAFLKAHSGIIQPTLSGPCIAHTVTHHTHHIVDHLVSTITYRRYVADTVRSIHRPYCHTPYTHSNTSHHTPSGACHIHLDHHLNCYCLVTETGLIYTMCHAVLYLSSFFGHFPF